MTVVYNAIDTVRFAPGVGDGARLDGLAGLPAALEGTVRLGLVATYARWKGQDLFMMAIGRVQSVRPARFYIVGRTDLQDDWITVFGRGASRAGRRSWESLIVWHSCRSRRKRPTRSGRSTW